MAKLLVAVCFTVAIIAAAKSDAGQEASRKFKTKEHSGTASRDKLLDELFLGYKTYNYPENTTIQFGVAILNVEFDQEKDVMETDVWFRYVWTDSRFSWDEEELGIKVMRVPAEKIWLPDTTLYNGVKQDMDCWKSNALIYPDGKIIWVPPCHLKSFCNLTLSHHPYEQQECMLKFGSWTFDGDTMGLDFYAGSAKADVENYVGRKYEITKNEAVKEEKTYDCCVEPYYSLKFNLGFTRKTPGADTCGGQ